MGWYREIEDPMGNNIRVGNRLVTGYVDTRHSGDR